MGFYFSIEMGFLSCRKWVSSCVEALTCLCFGASNKMFLLNSFNKQALRPQKPEKVVFIGPIIVATHTSYMSLFLH